MHFHILGNAALKDKHVAASAETTVKHSIAKPQNIEHVKSERKDSGSLHGMYDDLSIMSFKHKLCNQIVWIISMDTCWIYYHVPCQFSYKETEPTIKEGTSINIWSSII